MQKRATAVFTGLAALAILGWGSAAMAEEPTVAPAPEQQNPAEPPAQLPLPAAKPVLFRGKLLDDGSLADSRGGAQISDMKLRGVVADNEAVNIGMTGTNVISEGAFSNSSGVPMVIQNSGNNVLIQNATIVNVEVK
jgi:hypothetical protein